MIFVCLFVCPELIEELAGAIDLKFGKNVENVVSRNKTKDLSDISTNFWVSWPIRFEGLNQCNNLTNANSQGHYFDQYDFALYLCCQ